ncbi:FecR family protein [Psychroserpens jangbogonensis]|uniref:FecR family protein n=1 Tax=Psychroserpens jangbogonensis TaxID=1484460 RepID=UPI00053D12B4|nr:FecR family protein [Psychroserpens jangbogonensis]
MDKEDLIKKWLNDELTPAEKQTFEQGEDFDLHQAIINSAKQFKASNFSKPGTFNDLKSSYQSENSKVKQLDWFKPLLRIASVVVITLGIYFTFFNTNLTVIETIASQQTIIELPDHSKVTLNAGSEIKYSEADWSDKRLLNLKGEAYFKVAKGKTFNVVTSQGVVTVVGTEFNVKQRKNYFEVQCFEGVVKVTSRDISKTLVAGDTYRLLNKEFSQEKTTELYPQWTQNKSTFKAIPFNAVIAEMERQYDIKIIVENIDSKRLFTGGFMHNNIEKALFSITQPMDLSYKTNASNEVIIYGNKK